MAAVMATALPVGVVGFERSRSRSRRTSGSRASGGMKGARLLPRCLGLTSPPAHIAEPPAIVRTAQVQSTRSSPSGYYYAVGFSSSPAPAAASATASRASMTSAIAVPGTPGPGGLPTPGPGTLPTPGSPGEMPGPMPGEGPAAPGVPEVAGVDVLVGVLGALCTEVSDGVVTQVPSIPNDPTPPTPMPGPEVPQTPSGPEIPMPPRGPSGPDLPGPNPGPEIPSTPSGPEFPTEPAPPGPRPTPPSAGAQSLFGGLPSTMPSPDPMPRELPKTAPGPTDSDSSMGSAFPDLSPLPPSPNLGVPFDVPYTLQN